MDSKAWDERYAATELVWSAGPNQFVAAECADLEPGIAVDLAAGEGRNAIWLAQQGWNVTAVDYSQVGLDKGARLAAEIGVRPGTVHWVCADATTWIGAHLDLAVIAYLQLSRAERAAAHRNAFNALKPGGTFLLVAHDSTNLAEGTGGPQDPAVLMTAEDVLADLDAAGGAYDVVKAGRVARTVQAGDDHRGDQALTAWDCLVRVTKR
ncbi:class I SAM-dependent methyltransferase [Nocardioides gansuensis]|uniref:Class I SAM-dependent methyltransferase n=1 Tax=Nocardioides gansuensis TaxID=2138300 RepID=A0A2T8F7I7_9ACTN|nr:class I SAM-dependent methyltransferase [Nocardioides gansuensis]PVG81682.1 class I SAM-dependent methyltransferase [Nocardioides gansuensis]